MRCHLLVALIAFPASGCVSLTPKEVADPTKISVEEALGSVGRGFAAMNYELTRTNTPKLGLWPCKVTVNFNVTASADEKSYLVLSAAAKPVESKVTEATTTITADGKVEKTSTAEGKAGNVVAVEMYSIPCLPKETLGYEKPGEVGKVAESANRAARRSTYSMPAARMD